MNSSELSVEFEHAVELFNHVGGSLSFIFNSFVCLLILLDKDPRGKEYRKYLFSLQFFSTTADFFLSSYSMFALVNLPVTYSNSALSHVFDVMTAGILYTWGLGEIRISYLLCVYYRRRTVLSRGLSGWKYRLFCVVLQINAIILACILHYAGSLSLTQEIPNYISWIKNKQAYVIISTAKINYPILLFAIGCTLFVSGTTVFFIGQTMVEVKRGMQNSSPTTKRYQRRAVKSLALQGAVPSMCYTVPAFVLFGLSLYDQSSDNAIYNKTISSISVLSVNVLTSHAAVHSFTVLACSPSYREIVRSLFYRVAHRLFGWEPKPNAIEAQTTNRSALASVTIL